MQRLLENKIHATYDPSEKCRPLNNMHKAAQAY